MNKRLTRRTVAASTIGFAVLGLTGRASDATATPEASPAAASPAEQQLSWVLSVVNGDIPMPQEAEIEARFDEEFLTQFSALQIQELFTQFHDAGAPFVIDEVLDGSTDLALGVLATISDGSQLVISIVVEADKPHRITSLYFQPYNAAPDEIPPLASWGELEAKLAGVAPGYSIYATEVLGDGALEPIHAVNKGELFAIGSAFKFYVLAAVAQKIEAGDAVWDQTIEVTTAIKSFPSGVTQDEPDGATVAIEELANRMISISDNTATDMLLEFAGREACEAALSDLGHSDPARTMPFLKTKELFLLKLGGDTDRMDSYVAGDLATRREILAEMVDDPLPPLSDVASWTSPIAIDSIEWFATMPDLSRAMVWLWAEAAKPGLEPIRGALTLNPGVPFDDAVWSTIAFKGGSEPGVMALSWLLERKDGRTFTFACVVNNPEAAIPENDIALAAAGAFSLLADF